MASWQRYARTAVLLCLVLLTCAAIYAVADAGAMSRAGPDYKNRQRTGMSGKGVWFSIISFLTSIGWITTSEQETVRSSGLWKLAGSAAKTAKSPKEAEKGAVVCRPRVLCLVRAGRRSATTVRARLTGCAFGLCVVPAGPRYRPRIKQGDHRRLVAWCQNADRGACVSVRDYDPRPCCLTDDASVCTSVTADAQCQG